MQRFNSVSHGHSKVAQRSPSPSGRQGQQQALGATLASRTGNPLQLSLISEMATSWGTLLVSWYQASCKATQHSRRSTVRHCICGVRGGGAAHSFTKAGGSTTGVRVFVF